MTSRNEKPLQNKGSNGPGHRKPPDKSATTRSSKEDIAMTEQWKGACAQTPRSQRSTQNKHQSAGHTGSTPKRTRNSMTGTTPPPKQNKVKSNNTSPTSTKSANTTFSTHFRASNSNMATVHSLSNLTTIANDHENSQIGAQFLIQSAIHKLKPTGKVGQGPKEPEQRTTASTSATGNPGGAIEITKSPDPSHLGIPNSDIANLNITNPSEEDMDENNTQPDTDTSSTTDSQTTPLPSSYIFNIKSMDPSAPITKLSKIRVVRELTNDLTEFRVKYKREDHIIQLIIKENTDTEQIKNKTTLCGKEITIFETSQNQTNPTHPRPRDDNSRQTSWGKIYSDDLADCNDTEILEQLKIENEHIVMARRILRGPTRNPTKFIRIKFNTPKHPRKVYCCSDAYTVTPYVPPPKKCIKCKKYGHLVNDCRSDWACGTCAQFHPQNEQNRICQNQPACIYCGPGHGSNDPKCPRYQKEKEMVEISHEKNISFTEARTLMDNGTRSYASTLRANPIPNPSGPPPTPNLPQAPPGLIPPPAPTIPIQPPSTIETKTVGTDSPSISLDIKDLLNNQIKNEIEHALNDPNSKIITAKIPRKQIMCPIPIAGIVQNISQTLDSLQATHKPELNDALTKGLETLNTILETIQHQLFNDRNQTPNNETQPTPQIEHDG